MYSIELGAFHFSSVMSDFAAPAVNRPAGMQFHFANSSLQWAWRCGFVMRLRTRMTIDIPGPSTLAQAFIQRTAEIPR